MTVKEYAGNLRKVKEDQPCVEESTRRKIKPWPAASPSPARRHIRVPLLLLEYQGAGGECIEAPAATPANSESPPSWACGLRTSMRVET